MTLRFGCTACGRCCHDLRLPLSLREAQSWLQRGGEVELLTDAAPALPTQPDDPRSRYRRERALAGVSGGLAVTVNLTLAATFSGPCPHLLPTMRCGAYADRPSTCRIYPAELLPGRLVDPDTKACPPEAWDPSGPPLLSPDGRPADPDVARAARQARADGLADVAGKAQLAQLLGINTAALENEGLAVHRRPASALMAALGTACSMPAGPPEHTEWRFISPSAITRTMIEDAGAIATAAAQSTDTSFLSFGPVAQQHFETHEQPT